MRIYLFVDDEREQMFKDRSAVFIGKSINPCEKAFWAKNYNEAIDILNIYASGDNSIWVDFDHDLGVGPTGYDVAKYIVENQLPIEGFYVHSMNPVGSKNIIELLTHYGYKIGGR